MAADVDDPGHIALALLDYRVGEVEKSVETMGKDLTEVARQVTDIPGFISRKFEEQRAAIAETCKTRWDRIMQVGTLLAALGATAAAIFAKGHP